MQLFGRQNHSDEIDNVNSSLHEVRQLEGNLDHWLPDLEGI